MARGDECGSRPRHPCKPTVPFPCKPDARARESALCTPLCEATRIPLLAVRAWMKSGLGCNTAPIQARSVSDGDIIRRPQLDSRFRPLLRSSETGTMCELPHTELHMATNLAIDPELLERAVRVSGERTKKAAVTKALQEFIARREQRRVAELLGKLEWDSAFDYKAERTRRA